ncbi:MAG: PD-(D/E)XK nuclease family protein [Propionibacteriaceae bacterium]|jgi:exodeoxyribonuclease V beta subunit|nr:PD-(D/E)XK nuclease family protein [Propionibacteriaceae bacterium]
MTASPLIIAARGRIKSGWSGWSQDTVMRTAIWWPPQSLATRLLDACGCWSDHDPTDRLITDPSSLLADLSVDWSLRMSAGLPPVDVASQLDRMLLTNGWCTPADSTKRVLETLRHPDRGLAARVRLQSLFSAVFVDQMSLSADQVQLVHQAFAEAIIQVIPTDQLIVDTDESVTTVENAVAVRQWQMLVNAWQSPLTGPARAASLTDLLGWSINDWIDPSASAVGDLLVTWRMLGDIWRQHGLLAVFDRLDVNGALLQRLVAKTGNDRLWKSLHQVALAASRPRPRALNDADWLAEQANRSPVHGKAVVAELSQQPVAVGTRAADLASQRLNRPIEQYRRRSSFSALTRRAHLGPSMRVAPTKPSCSGPTTANPEPALPWSSPSPMAALPTGATFGTFIHQLLEEANPSAPPHEVFDHPAWSQSLEGLDRQQVMSALDAVWSTPLGNTMSGLCLRDLDLADRVSEMSFEFPLSSDDGFGLGQLADLWQQFVPTVDPFAAYAARLRRPELDQRPLRGWLVGAIDLLCRIGDRYFVIDYKTNWLGPTDQPLTLEAYHPHRLTEAMMEADYPLQALIYSVAAHRLLAARLIDYQPDRQFGGVLYLFIRGMAGPNTPHTDGQPAGVSYWLPPIGLVAACSTAFAGATASIRGGDQS